ncbi:MAG: hypothetical protein FWD50_07965, partial [Betaproteobacteria bacterium]|nr:hypothetical protein [Betaproteobacteria bacterium]
MSPERCLDCPPELPEWRRSGPFLLIAAALHLTVLACPRTPAVAAAPLPLQVQFIAAQAMPAMPELLPVSAPPPPPAKPAPDRPVRQKTRPVLAMSPEQQAVTPTTPLVAAPPEEVTDEAPSAPAVALA